MAAPKGGPINSLVDNLVAEPKMEAQIRPLIDNLDTPPGVSPVVNSLIAENRFRPLIENLVLPPEMVPLVKQLIAEPQAGPITPLFDEMDSTRQLDGPITP